MKLPNRPPPNTKYKTSKKIPKEMIEEPLWYLRQLTYRQYLLTQHWKDIRLKKLASVDYKCEECKNGQELQVHHRTYINICREKLKDLQVLCSTCHKKQHTEQEIW